MLSRTETLEAMSVWSWSREYHSAGTLSMVAVLWSHAAPWSQWLRSPARLTARIGRWGRSLGGETLSLPMWSSFCWQWRRSIGDETPPPPNSHYVYMISASFHKIIASVCYINFTASNSYMFHRNSSMKKLITFYHGHFFVFFCDQTPTKKIVHCPKFSNNVHSTREWNRGETKTQANNYHNIKAEKFVLTSNETSVFMDKKKVAVDVGAVWEPGEGGGEEGRGWHLAPPNSYCY